MTHYYITHVRVAQWIARWTSNPEVVGSNPTVDDFFSSIYVSTILTFLNICSLFKTGINSFNFNWG